MPTWSGLLFILDTEASVYSCLSTNQHILSVFICFLPLQPGMVFEGVGSIFFPNVTPCSGHACLFRGSRTGKTHKQTLRVPWLFDLSQWRLCWSGELSFACLATCTPLSVLVAAPHDQENGSSASLQLPKASYSVILTQRGPLHLYPPNLFRYVSNLLYQNELSSINFQNHSQ